MSYAAHAPVMIKEVLAALAPKAGGIYVDATFGGGAYTRAILKAADCSVYGFDRDATVLERAKNWAAEFGDRLRLINRPFAEMVEALREQGVGQVDGVVFDLGVSSMQLDEAERGFSFRQEGPLSMRMDGGRPDAGDVVAFADVRELSAIFRFYGEEKRSGVIARAIVAERDRAPILTTTALATIVEKAAPAPGSKIHPATRIFQALRIFVNNELGQLVEGLHAAEELLCASGRLVAVTFHSLEDRIVKRFFANRSPAQTSGSRHAPPTEKIVPSFQPLYRKAIEPQAEEVETNPRSRSAKLRAGIRLDGPSVIIHDENLGEPRRVTVKNMQKENSL
ncbi:MAG: 16S rRNA (cytosine(1402)-N(4))-methyltransferase RsmH [Marinicaulis sp.]|nr:16S rRNA (cytosine(1402)-N(4))-methyltransferase RsmH [Marinicaulis sp.]